jgi:hypothetical protein
MRADAKNIPVHQTYGALEEHGVLVVMSPLGGPIMLRINEMFFDLVERHIAERNVLYYFKGPLELVGFERKDDKSSLFL